VFFWVLTPGSLVDIDRRFRGAYVPGYFHGVFIIIFCHVYRETEDGLYPGRNSNWTFTMSVRLGTAVIYLSAY
jgi:hypothetical protein